MPSAVSDGWETGHLDAGHPYGVKPAGNALCEEGGRNGRDSVGGRQNILDFSLGALRAFNDG
jgi:hypothetical protein